MSVNLSDALNQFRLELNFVLKVFELNFVFNFCSFVYRQYNYNEILDSVLLKNERLLIGHRIIN